MEIGFWLLVVALLLLFFVAAALARRRNGATPLIRGRRRLVLSSLLLPFLPYVARAEEDSEASVLQIAVTPHPFGFRRDPNNPLNAKIIEAINRMGDTGENAEARYQKALNALRPRIEAVIGIVAFELQDIAESRYMDRWSLVQLLADLRHDAALPILDRVLAQPIPRERSQTPHRLSTVREEVIIRTTAVEAISRIAANGNRQALELLLKYARHPNFSVKRESIQSYLEHGGPNARATLKKRLPERDHHIMEIRRTDLSEVLQPVPPSNRERPEETLETPPPVRDLNWE